MSHVKEEQVQVTGAIYISARAYNPYQMWRDYDRSEAERDLGFAESLNLNALRIWLSYEYWLEQPDEMKEKLDHLLLAASRRGIRVMPCLFECCGVEQSRDKLVDVNPLTAVDVNSPAEEIFMNESRWGEPGRFVEWFMRHYRSDHKLLAVEVINEPHLPLQLKFARAMFKIASSNRGMIPLTVGSITIRHNQYFLDLGLDILQFHSNFPHELEGLQEDIAKAKETGDVLGKPVWLTEWQRLRTGRIGWGGEGTDFDEWQPGYATLADIVLSAGIGTFFWSLMIKPAYLLGQRKSGTLNGIFHEDGSVWSLEDARAISGNPDFNAVERKEWPEWAALVEQS